VKIAISTILLLLTTLLFTIGCGSDTPEARLSTDSIADSLMPDQVTSQAHIYMTSGGHRTTDLKAVELQQFTSRDSTVAVDLDAIFFDTSGEQISTLTANKGFIREKDNFLAVNGDVVVIGEDSVKLYTQYLEWDAANDRVVTDSFVTVIQGTDTLTSYGMVTDPRLRDITFKRQVNAQVSDLERVNDDKK